MLPLHQAYEVRTAVLEYIKATFQFKDLEVGKKFYEFIEDKKNGLFKGPYISLKTPFVKVEEDEEIPLDIRPGFTPHYHQIAAFCRLTTLNGHQPQPTLLTTGTGSGKTECFLYPVLDYVYQMNRDGYQRGVKVIIMYPMNALASDQAKRLAEVIWNDERLKGSVTAGLFIGEGKDKKIYPEQMGPSNIIESREKIVKNVPDILLTNFKMLDYALMRNDYADLWKGNIDAKQPMLRFMVLDELHTYDGAQGTDVANLIRRLKLKLNIPNNWLTPVGTSATIGNESESKQLLCEYATDVFGETFTHDSIIEEHRQHVDDFFGDDLDDYIPEINPLRKLSIDNMTGSEAYLKAVRNTWLPRCTEDVVEIGVRLKKLQLAKDLLSVTAQGILLLDDIIVNLGRRNAAFQRLVREYPDCARNAVEGLLSLIGQAKMEGGRFPLLYLQVQLWQRELSGIQRVVQQEPAFTWRDAIPHDDRMALPMYFCRDCGTSGWLTTMKRGDSKLGADALRIMQDFMRGDKDVMLMNTETPLHQPVEEYKNADSYVDETAYIHIEDLSFGAKTDEGIMSVRLVSRGYSGKNAKNIRFDKKCPLCMDDSIAIVGGRTSTLSSVAVSQVMSSDFEGQNVGKRKMLTFSNSVQDAAHLAGFYEVRTFRFLFRQSIQQYLKTVGHAMSLAELQEGFKNYWKERLPDDEYYYRFIPDELIEKVNLEHSYRENGQLTEKFRKEFDLRVDWEICSEFGLMSQIGRTLEKMGSSATFFEEETLRYVFKKMVPWMEENNLDFVVSHEDLFLPFVNGILHRLRMRGGVDHEFLRLFRTHELKQVCLNWGLRGMKKEHFLHKTFGHNRVPKLLGTESVGREEILDVTSVKNRQNWFYTYFVKALLNPSMELRQPNPEIINDFYRELLETLTDCGVLNRKEAHGVCNYAIVPLALLVQPKVQQLKCHRCGSKMYVALSDTLTERTHCLDFKCLDGQYNVPDTETSNYYRMVYDREMSPRIYAHEHTGLLERGDREKIEREFKNHPSAHSINVLTATSTLEMGIDIGDLNIVANTGIPPRPANFLQRVGRAGRKEGSALVLNYAKGAKHDMFYFMEPLSMMEGKVGTPGCFLGAKDILRRHFYAYCIDSWTTADNNNSIPQHIKWLHLAYSLLTDDQFFVNRITQFIKDNFDVLASRFRKQYPDDIQPVLDELFDAVRSGSLEKRVLDEFENLIEQMEYIRKERKELKKRLDEIPQTDTERRADIMNQNRGLNARLNTILEQTVVEFMTNNGLLPNYAFPETGVKLFATILNSRPLGDESTDVPEPDALELVRPASQGIKELAPGNEFYTQKLCVEVKGLSLNDRTDSVKMMRYCSDCDALAQEGTDEYNMGICPKCGSQSWRQNKHKYLKLTTATSTMYRKDAAMDDKKDDRDRKQYHTQKHYKFNYNGPVTSYGLKNVAFGIEFCKDVELTEANYGSSDQMSDMIEVNKNQRISNLGFLTCKSCGKTTIMAFGGTDKVADMHYPYCHHKDVGFPEDVTHAGTFEKLFLYRTMQTEAIKVLLPVKLFDTKASVELFKAGLELGMRHYYKSNPEHLRIDGYVEFNKTTQEEDNYLVIYDTIPGGTGYLSKLYDTKEFSELIRISYEKIRDCGCKHEGKDGCYHCILTYGNQWQREHLSRERAEELFAHVYEECDNWEIINGNVGSIATSGVVEDSELELLFVKTMQRISKEKNWKWTKVTDSFSDSYKYELLIEDDERCIKYVIHPQYRLGPSVGVAKETKPDFQFICTFATIKGVEIDVTTIPQWSVYLDGYAYHASESNMGFYNDFQRREAIRMSDREPRLSWTLTWSDIKPYVDDDATVLPDSVFKQPLSDLVEEFENKLWRKKDSVSRFIFMLCTPNMETMRKEVMYMLASCWTDEGQYMSSYANIDKAVSENARNQYATLTAEEEDAFHFFVKTTFVPRNVLLNGSAWYPYDKEDDFYDSVRFDWNMKANLPELSKDDWEDFWRRYNLLQLFRNKYSVEDEPIVDLDEILLYFPGLEDVVTELVENKIGFDAEGGYELRVDGIIVAEAAIKIDGKDIIIDDFSGREDMIAKFECNGFKVLTPETFNINDVK